MTKDITPFARYLGHVITTLKNRDFVFIIADASGLEDIERQLDKADATNAKLLPWMMRLVGFMYGMPGPLQGFMPHFMSVKHEAAEASAAERLFGDMKKHFPLNAFRFSTTGVQYLSCLHCDDLSVNQLSEKARVFADLAWGMKSILGKLKTRILGIPFKAQEQNVHASLCLTFTDQQVFEGMAVPVSSLNLRSMTIRERLQWMKIYVPIWYLASPPKGKVYLEKIVYRTYDNHIESSKILHTQTMYGFSISDLVLPASILA